jgi:aspartyl protease family protein
MLRAAGLLLVALACLGASTADPNEAGKAAYARGDYEGALALFTRALGQAPSDPLLHYHHGVALTALGRWQEAARAYRTALRLGPPPAVAAAAREALREIAPLGQASARPAPRPHETPIPLERGPGGWLAEVVLNDTRAARFLVDTGASVSVVSPEIARELGIGAGGDAAAVELRTISGRTSGTLVVISSVRVGDSEADDVRAVVHAVGPGMDGILGNSFLGRFTVTIDPERRELRLRPR